MAQTYAMVLNNKKGSAVHDTHTKAALKLTQNTTHTPTVHVSTRNFVAEVLAMEFKKSTVNDSEEDERSLRRALQEGARDWQTHQLALKNLASQLTEWINEPAPNPEVIPLPDIWQASTAVKAKLCTFDPFAIQFDTPCHR